MIMKKLLHKSLKRSVV